MGISRTGVAAAAVVIAGLTGCSLIVPSSDDIRFSGSDGGADASLVDGGGVDGGGTDGGATDGGPDAAADACGGTCEGDTPFCSPGGECVACLTVEHCDDDEFCTTDSCTASFACENTAVPSCIRDLSAAGNHTCAVRMDGEVRCWGSNSYGQLGNGDSGDGVWTVARPVIVSFVSDAVEVGAGNQHTCVRRESGELFCWGTGTDGQLGNGMGADSPTRVPVDSVDNAETIVAGHSHNLTMRGDIVSSWGAGMAGQLGDGFEMNRLSPVNVIGLPAGTVAVGAGTSTSCAVHTSGTVMCWGSSGLLGNDGATGDTPTPVPVLDLADAVQIDVANSHACAVRRAGEVACWGAGTDGRLGHGVFTNSERPVPVDDIDNAVEVSLGLFSSCARLDSGEVRCWGGNEVGQLGTATSGSVAAPVAVDGLRDANLLTVGNFHACARRATGDVVCWGINRYGQLGNDGTTGLGEFSSAWVTVVGL